MQVVFESRDRAGAALRDIAEQRLRFVLRRLTRPCPDDPGPCQHHMKD